MRKEIFIFVIVLFCAAPTMFITPRYSYATESDFSIRNQEKLIHRKYNDCRNVAQQQLDACSNSCTHKTCPKGWRRSCDDKWIKQHDICKDIRREALTNINQQRKQALAALSALGTAKDAAETILNPGNIISKAAEEAVYGFTGKGEAAEDAKDTTTRSLIEHGENIPEYVIPGQRGKQTDKIGNITPEQGSFNPATETDRMGNLFDELAAQQSK